MFRSGKGGQINGEHAGVVSHSALFRPFSAYQPKYWNTLAVADFVSAAMCCWCCSAPGSKKFEKDEPVNLLQGPAYFDMFILSDNLTCNLLLENPSFQKYDHAHFCWMFEFVCRMLLRFVAKKSFQSSLDLPPPSLNIISWLNYMYVYYVHVYIYIHWFNFNYFYIFLYLSKWYTSHIYIYILPSGYLTVRHGIGGP